MVRQKEEKPANPLLRPADTVNRGFGEDAEEKPEDEDGQEPAQGDAALIDIDAEKAESADASMFYCYFSGFSLPAESKGSHTALL